MAGANLSSLRATCRASMWNRLNPHLPGFVRWSRNPHLPLKGQPLACAVWNFLHLFSIDRNIMPRSSRGNEETVDEETAVLYNFEEESVIPQLHP